MSVSKTHAPITKRDLGCPRLYREDLREIAEAVSELGTLKIECVEPPGDIPSHNATGPDDFIDLPEKLTSVIIKASKADSGGIEVNLSPKAATAELTARSTQARRVLMQIQDVCEQRRRKARSLVRWAEVAASPLVILLIVVVGVALGLGISYLIARVQYGNGPVTVGWSTTNTLVTALVVVLLAAASGIILLARRPRTMIINAPQDQRPTFRQRNKDAIQVGLLTGVPSALIGTLIGYLLGKFA